MNTINQNINDLNENIEKLKEISLSESNKNFNIKLNDNNDSYKNSDLIGLQFYHNIKEKTNYDNPPNENSKNNENNDINNKIKDLSYYHQLINSLNNELGLITENLNDKNIINNTHIPKNNDKNMYKKNIIYDKKRKNRINNNIYKNNIINEDVINDINDNNNKLKELENNKQFLLDKNKEIEDQINNLQNLAQKVNLINEKNNFYYNNIYKEDEQQYVDLKPEIQNNINNNNISNYSNYILNEQTQTNDVNNSNVNYLFQDKYVNNNIDDNNNYIQIEDDNYDQIVDDDYNIDINNDINLHEGFNKENINNKMNIKKIKSKKINYLKKTNSYNKAKKINNNSTTKIKTNKIDKKINIKKSNLTLDEIEKEQKIFNTNNYTNKNKKMIRKNSGHKSCISLSAKTSKIKDSRKFNNYIENHLSKKLIEEFNMYETEGPGDKFELIKNIIMKMNNQNFNKNTKNFLLDKINELHTDYVNRISLIEKKYKSEIDKKNRKINKLEKDNSELKKKVSQIKSIV